MVTGTMATKPADVQFTSIFGGAEPAALVGPGISVTARRTPPMATIAAWPGTVDALARLMAKSGIDLPQTVGTSLRSKLGCIAHCQAPGRWLIEHPGVDLPNVPAGTGTVTNLDHARSSFIFEGENAVELAQKLAPIDFGLQRHGPMSFVQSGSDHSTSFALWRETETRFIAYVERSFGRDFWDTLELESAEFRA